MKLLAELKRRNVIRMAGLYLVGAWLIVQVAETLLPIFEAPGWVLKVLVVLLALGFVPALVFSWLYELTPEGLKRDGEVSAADSIAPQTARRMERLIALGLVAVIALVAADRYWPRAERPPESAAVALTVADSGGKDPPAADARPPEVAANSIAVLPFADLSQTGDQAYFSDGISEEILNALVKVRGLHVASRTSSFGFKGQEALGVPAIAEKLAVRHVLEGSVRRAGNALRITAQLIDAESDRHLWSETYDRPLTAENVFAIQEEIATAIVAALALSLGVSEVGSVALPPATANLGAYDVYLRARALLLARRELAEAERLLQQSVEQDPNFAKAWELRAAVTSLMHDYQASELGIDELDRLSIGYAERALALDPQSSLALAVLAKIRGNVGRNSPGRADYRAVIADFERAIEIDPHNVNAMNWLGMTLSLLGDSEGALAMYTRCSSVDPLFGPCAENGSDTLWVLGRTDEAYAQALDAWSRGAIVDNYVNFPMLARHEQKAAFLLSVTSWLPKWNRGEELYEAFRQLERDHSALRDDLLRFLAGRKQPQFISAIVIPLGGFDAPPPAWLMWSPEFERYRHSPQFKHFIESAGVLAYWQAHGFPPQCRPLGEADFECDRDGEQT